MKIWDNASHTVLHEAEAVLLRAAGEVKDASYAIGVEHGFAQGAEHTAKRILAETNVVARPSMLDILERIQLFRQTIATYDTRYSMLGEIIADFATLVGPADAVEGET